MSKTMVIYGKNGQLAICLKSHAADFGFDAINIGRPEFELSDYEKLQSAIGDLKPDLIINASAYNDVDRAESENEIAMQINAYGPQNLARIAASLDIPIIHVSTDYVFDGEENALYSESDATDPVNFYGKTKREGEILVARANRNHAIVRTSWVYSEFSSNYPKKILQFANDGRASINIVNDQFGSPTSAHDLAKALLEMGRQLIENPQKAELRGIFHCSSSNPASRFEFTQHIFSRAKKFGLKCCDIIEVKASHFKSAAKRPTNTALDCNKLARIYSIKVRDWQTAFDEINEKVVETITKQV